MDQTLINDCVRILLQAVAELQTNEENVDIVIDRLETVAELIPKTGHPQIEEIYGLINNAASKLKRPEMKSNAGRPAFLISEETIEHFLSMDFKVPQIAKLLQVSKRTIYNRMTVFGLKVSDTYSQITDDYLDQRIEEILLNHPTTGYKRMRGFLRVNGIKVTVSRIRESMRRVDPLGVEARRKGNRAVVRREYFVKYSMQIWHIDTHHKLIRWGFIVRGGIDGKSRCIVYLDAGRDNKASSNLESFMTGIKEYGIPLHTRSDKGGENVLIADYMIQKRGVDRGSHICGRSVHNQRIERLWRDVYYGCLTSFKTVFMWLEEQGHLQVDNPKHIAILQYVFLPRINKNLQEFKESWNVHPLSSENDKTPAQMMLLHLPPKNLDLTDDETHEASEHDDEEEENQVVEIEDFYGYLTDQEFMNLQQIDPLQESEMFGADIFMEGIRLMMN